MKTLAFGIATRLKNKEIFLVCTVEFSGLILLSLLGTLHLNVEEGSYIAHHAVSPKGNFHILQNQVFRREPYSVRSGDIVYNRVIKFKLT